MTAFSSRGLSFLCALFFLVVVVVGCFAFPCRSFGQTGLAGVSGRITDASGAVIVDAEVEIKNVETGISTAVKTNQDGLYTIPSLHPGHYLINVRKTGFRSVTVTELTLNVQDNVVRNFALQIGSVSETVTITADQLNINTTDATVSTVIDRQFAENLPLNGRSFQALVQLTPGVVLTANNSRDTGQFSVNGQRATSNYWMVDGVSANIGVTPSAGLFTGVSQGAFAGATGSSSILGGTNSLVSVDALQEFRIQTSTYAPEFGRTPGAQISIVTRSGSNQFHGTAFDYLRNDVLDANNWFNGFKNNPPLPKAKDRQNDFGGTFGGPIFRNRTFFFFSYEGLRLRLPQTALTTVPCDSSCQVFGNARSMAMSAMQPFLNAFPLPNGTEVFTPCTPNVNGCPASGQRPTGSAQFNASFSNQSSLDASSIRIDHKLSDKLSVFGRYNHSPSDLAQRGALNLNTANTINKSRLVTNTATIGATWTISPRILEELRFNYSEVYGSGRSDLDNLGGAAPLPSLSFPSPFDARSTQFSFNIRLLAAGVLTQGPGVSNLQRQINVTDSVTFQLGKHTIKTGFDFRRLSPRHIAPPYGQSVQFADMNAAKADTLFFSFIQVNQPATMLLHNLGAYAQDIWRVIPRLTVTYGLRWDVDYAPSTANPPDLLAVNGFNPVDLSRLAVAAPGTPPFNTRYGNVAPRLGIAYQLAQDPKWSTVLRGGFGLFYDLATSEVAAQLANSYPFGSNKVVSGGSLPLSATAAAPPPVSVASLASTVANFSDPGLNLPYTLQWNAALEQTLGAQQALSLSYIGAAGRRLLQTSAVSFFGTGNPNFTTIDFVTNRATSDYNALQVQFNRRISHGLQAIASYTWAHALDTASAGSIGSISNAGVPSLSPDVNRAPAAFDIRHSFSLGLTYDTPGPRNNRLARAILKGWSTENIVQARTAAPVDLLDSRVLPFLFVLTVRPDVVPGQPLYLFGSQFPGGKAFNPAAFADPPVQKGPTGFITPTRQGTLGRNALRGFGAAQWDFAVRREFPVRESLKLQFRAEMFNVLNHPNFGPPNDSLSSSSFGVATQMFGESLAGSNVGGGAFSPLYQIGGPRSIQVALKLSF